MTGVLLSPFSNSGIRDWPGSHFRALIRLLMDRLPRDVPIRVTGTANHRLRANEIVRPFPADRVLNQCGRLTLAELAVLIRRARCVVVNNSGVAHLAGRLGAPTVEIFAGTHQRREWRALGNGVVLVSRAIGCAPCQLDHGQTSPYDKACLREITPEAVFAAVEMAIGQTAASADGRSGREKPLF